MRRRILSENVSDEKIFLFFSLLGKSIPHLVLLSGLRRMTFQFGEEPFFNGLRKESRWLHSMDVVWSRPSSMAWTAALLAVPHDMQSRKPDAEANGSRAPCSTSTPRAERPTQR